MCVCACVCDLVLFVRVSADKQQPVDMLLVVLARRVVKRRLSVLRGTDKQIWAAYFRHQPAEQTIRHRTKHQITTVLEIWLSDTVLKNIPSDSGPENWPPDAGLENWTSDTGLENIPSDRGLENWPSDTDLKAKPSNTVLKADYQTQDWRTYRQTCDWRTDHLNIWLKNRPSGTELKSRAMETGLKYLTGLTLLRFVINIVWYSSSVFRIFTTEFEYRKMCVLSILNIFWRLKTRGIGFILPKFFFVFSILRKLCYRNCLRQERPPIESTAHTLTLRKWIGFTKRQDQTQRHTVKHLPTRWSW